MLEITSAWLAVQALLFVDHETVMTHGSWEYIEDHLNSMELFQLLFKEIWCFIDFVSQINWDDWESELWPLSDKPQKMYIIIPVDLFISAIFCPFEKQCLAVTQVFVLKLN